MQVDAINNHNPLKPILRKLEYKDYQEVAAVI